MDQPEQRLELIEQTLAISSDVGVGRFADKAQFADQMRQAKLDRDGGLFHIGSIR